MNHVSSGIDASRILLAESSRWTCAHRVAIALAGAGSEVSAVCPASNHPLLKTRAITRTFPYSAMRPLKSLLEAIESVQPQLVIPCDDLVVYHLHQLYAQAVRTHGSSSALAGLIQRSLGNAAYYSVVSSRSQLLDVAREQGLLTPATCEIRTAKDFNRWQETHASPWVLKIDRTWGGRGVRIAATPDEGNKLFREMTRLFGDLRAVKELCVNGDPIWIRLPWSRLRPAITAQQYIAGRPANCAFACWNGEVLAGISVEAVETQEATGPATVVRVVNSPDMMLCATRLAKRLELSGFIGLDFVIQDGTNACYLIEMNPRCTPLCHLRLGAGRDMVGAMCAQLSGKPFPAPPPVTDHDLIAYFPQAWHAQSKYLSRSYHDIPEGEPELVQMLLDASSDSGRSKHMMRRVAARWCGTGYVAASAPATPAVKSR
jgi:hypothetical protein